jgi:hypothetical protein
MISLPKKFQVSLTIGVALVGLIVFLPACTKRQTLQLGTHKVTVARHGFEKKFHVTQNASVPTLEYEGLSADRRRLQVSIRGDKVTVNGIEGQLRPGDSVLISDDGVAVNSLDYGESEKYLRGNNSPADVTSLN